MGAVYWVNRFGLFNAMFVLAIFLWIPMLSAVTLYKHTCHLCEAADRAASRVFNVMEDYLARIQTANKAQQWLHTAITIRQKPHCCKANAAPKTQPAPVAPDFFQVRWWQMGHANETVPAVTTLIRCNFMAVSISSTVGWGEANADGCFIQFAVAIKHHD